MDYDINYITEIMSNLCGIPGRIYINGVKKRFISSINFPVDPAILIENTLNNYKDHIGYFYAEDFYFYCYINYQDTMILFGPSRMVKADDSILSKLCLSLNLNRDYINEFKSAMNSLIPFPLESLLQALISLNYIFNNEKITLKDILIDDDKVMPEISSDYPNNDNYVEHNTFDIEQKINQIVEHGDIKSLDEWIKNAPAVRGGILSNDALRQMKNTFIATATLVSRSAIKGGLDISEALNLSDLYIRQMESMSLFSDISTLQVKMVYDYTNRVAKIRGTSNGSTFLMNINKYIYSHLSNAIKSQDICKNLYISKSVLFDKIKKETGLTVSQYILKVKIDESKNLLKFSDNTLLSISQYLGFSSQSHYIRTFKKECGITPKKYREDHQR